MYILKDILKSAFRNYEPYFWLIPWLSMCSYTKTTSASLLLFNISIIRLNSFQTIELYKCFYFAYFYQWHHQSEHEAIWAKDKFGSFMKHLIFIFSVTTLLEHLEWKCNFVLFYDEIRKLYPITCGTMVLFVSRTYYYHSW